MLMGLVYFSKGPPGTGGGGPNFANSFFGSSSVPTLVDGADGASYTMGFQFTNSSSTTQIVGARFFKATTNTGTHVGRLFSLTANNVFTGATTLATVTFTGETSSGWQYMPFASPVTLSSTGAWYIIAVDMPNGHYSIDTPNQWSGPRTTGPLTAGNGGGTENNGLFVSPAGTIPNTAFNASNYWVDLLWQ